MDSLRVASIGEIMVELSVGDGLSIETKVNFAGDTANTAVYLHREAAEHVSVSYISVVGQDALSDRLLDFLNSEGLETGHIRRHPTRPPGLYAINIDEHGERTFVYWRDSSAARTLFQSPDTASGDEVEPDIRAALDTLMGFDIIYYSGITLAILPASVREGFLDWLETFRAQGGQVAFDSNYRPALWQNQREAQQATVRAWSQCDIALPSADDEMLLFEDVDVAATLARLRGYGLPDGALKRGAGGPIPINPSLSLEPLTVATQVVDTTAAGDSFNGAYLAAHVNGADALDAMRAGHHRAIDVIGQRGAIVPR